MSPEAATDICRVTVVGPRKRVDLALPGTCRLLSCLRGSRASPSWTRRRWTGHQKAGRCSGWVSRRSSRPSRRFRRGWPTVSCCTCGPGRPRCRPPRPTTLPTRSPGCMTAPAGGTRPATGAGWRSARGRPPWRPAWSVLFRSGPPWPVTAMAAGLLAVLLLAAGARFPGPPVTLAPERSSATRRCPTHLPLGSSRRCGRCRSPTSARWPCWPASHWC